MNLEAYAKQIEDMRMDMLFENAGENEDELSAVAEQHYLAALAALELAERSMKLAHLHEDEASKVKALIEQMK